MSDRNLIEFINKVCPRKIDFLYLRMYVLPLALLTHSSPTDTIFRDFMNGCNVGYGTLIIPFVPHRVI
jgi:hypothetical protein